MSEKVRAQGTVRIYEDALAVIAALAAREVKGVHNSSNFLHSINDMFNRRNVAKGVRVEVKDNQVSLEIKLAVEYGTPISQLAWEIQENVKNTIESMAGLQVVAVDVVIEAVKFPEVCSEDK